MPRPDLLTVGEAFEDLVFVGLERLPRPGEEIRTSRFHATVGGGSIITAVAAARLGLACGVVTAAGPTAAARLRRERVRLVNLRKPGEAPAVTAALSTSTDRSFVTFTGVNDVLERRLLASLGRLRARHVHFAFRPRACRRWAAIIARLRAAGTTTSWDLGWDEQLAGDPHVASLLDAPDFVFLNEQEAPLYAGCDSLDAAIERWRGGPRHVIVKLGARGSRWLSSSIDLHVPAPRARVVDTTGAGDAFNGGFLHGVLRGAPPATCLRLGNHVGAMSTRRAGGLDGLPHLDRVPARLRAVS